jgi:hypothetical protein
MTRLREWVLGRIRDDVKHAEIDAREARSEDAVEELRSEVEKNGFGRLFQDQALRPVYRPHHPRGTP